MFKKSTSNYQTFHNVEMDPLLRRIQRGYISDDDDDINNVTYFGYTLAGAFITSITIILVVVLLF
jgi:hypothetical protein